jgi:IS5 family transposase
MAWKELKQQSFADALQASNRFIEEFDEIHDLLNWSCIERLFCDIHNRTKGERAWPPLMMFKALLLQSWHNLSDPSLEKALARDLLFRRFVGVGLDQGVPDHSTIWRFRNLLEKNGLLDAAMTEINAQLAEQSLIIKQGEISIIDASVIEAKNARPRKNAEGKNTQEAGYSVKQSSDGKRKTTYGFKAHTNVDEDGFVKEVILTAGNVHDSIPFESILTDHEREVYADSAYKSAQHSRLLKQKKVKECITHRAYRNRPLNEDQEKQNRYFSSIRSRVEHVFGIVKLHYGLGKARYMGIARNQARVSLICMAYNLKRAVRIQRECRDGK